MGFEETLWVNINQIKIEEMSNFKYYKKVGVS